MGRLSPADFHTVYGFRRPGGEAFGGLTPGLRSGLSLHPLPEVPGLRCCPSSLYTFPAAISPGFGSGLPFKVSPNLSSSASPVSQASTQVSLSPLRMPFRHARARLSYTHDRARCPILHIRFLVTSLRLRGSLNVIFHYLIPLLPHDIDSSGVERRGHLQKPWTLGSHDSLHL
jgi:hypothetical protein